MVGSLPSATRSSSRRSWCSAAAEAARSTPVAGRSSPHRARSSAALFADAAIVIDAQIPADADDPRLKVRPPIERSSALKIFRKMSCVRSSTSSCLPTNCATLNTFRQFCRTTISQAT